MNVNTGELFRMTPEMEKRFAKELMEHDSPIKPVPDDFWERTSFEMSDDEEVEGSYDVRRSYVMLLDGETELAEVSLRIMNS